MKTSAQIRYPQHTHCRSLEGNQGQDLALHLQHTSDYQQYLYKMKACFESWFLKMDIYHLICRVNCWVRGVLSWCIREKHNYLSCGNKHIMKSWISLFKITYFHKHMAKEVTPQLFFAELNWTEPKWDKLTESASTPSPLKWKPPLKETLYSFNLKSMSAYGKDNHSGFSHSN